MELGLFYIYWLTGSLPCREYFTRVLAVTFFSFWKAHFWSSRSYSSTDLHCGKTWSSATKGRLWSRLLDQQWPGWGLQGQIPCAVKMCYMYYMKSTAHHEKYSLVCVRRGASGTALKTPDKKELWEWVRGDDADNCIVYSSLGRKLKGYKNCPRFSFAERLTWTLGLGGSSASQPLLQSYVFWLWADTSKEGNTSWFLHMICSCDLYRNPIFLLRITFITSKWHALKIRQLLNLHVHFLLLIFCC